MILKLMQKHGHRPIILGGGTTLIGDPSGKDAKKILNQDDIKNNIKSIKKVFNKILDTTNKKTSPIF